MHKIKSGLFLGFFCFTTLLSQAQVTSVSPLSRFGLGDLQSDAFASGFGSGGITQAFRHSRNLNIGNPASFSALRLTTFEVGLSQNSYLQSTTNAQESWNHRTNLGYVAVGVPFTKWWGFSASVSPFSQSGFRSTFTGVDPSFGSVEYVLNGAGSFSRFQVGNGFKVIKGLSLGISINYIWGRRLQTNDLNFLQNNFYSFRNEENFFAQGFFTEFGLQYEQPLNKKGLSLIAGATWNGGADLRQERTLLDYTFLQTELNNVPKDTVRFFQDNGSKLRFPQRGGAGLTLQQTKEGTSVPAWMISGEFRYQNWSEMQLAGSSGTFFNSNRLGIGASLIPALAWNRLANSSNLFSKIEYRAGFYSENGFANINSTQLTDRGMTIGFAIPLNHKLFAGEERYSKFTVSAALGQRGDLQNFGYQERYSLILIGISVNDKWFNKFKYR